MLIATHAQAATCGTTQLLTAGGAAFTDIDISSGAVTATELGVDKWDYATIHFDLTDANNSVTNLRWSFTVSDASGGTQRVYDDCSTTSPTMTCNGQLVIDRDPQTKGKNWAMPFPTQAEWMTLTFTPTGHDAGDELSVKIRGCWAGVNR